MQCKTELSQWKLVYNTKVGVVGVYYHCIFSILLHFKTILNFIKQLKGMQ